MARLLRAAWQFRYFVLSSVRNELRSRFARSSLGALWMILHPLAQVIIFTVVLSQLLAARLPGVTSAYGYSIYLMAGFLCWSLFAELVTRLLTVFLDNANLMKKLVFPRVALVLAAIGLSVINNILLLLVMLVIVTIAGHALTWHVIALPALMIVTILLGAGLGVVLGVLNVFVRDIGHVMPIIMQFWFWFTPIVYASNILPERVLAALRFNPVYPLVSQYQNALLFQGAFNWAGLLYPLLLGCTLSGLGYWAFHRLRADMMDQL